MDVKQAGGQPSDGLTTAASVSSDCENLSRLFNHDLSRGQWKRPSDFFWAFLGHTLCMRNLALVYYFHEWCGGAAVFIPMIIFSAFLYYPLSFIQTFMGHFSSTGFLSVYRVSPFYKGVGYSILIYNIFSLAYFGVIAAYPLAQMYKILSYEPPWKESITFNATNDLNFNWAIKIVPEIFDSNSSASVYFLKNANDLYNGWNDPSMGHPLMFCVALLWIFVVLCHLKGFVSVRRAILSTMQLTTVLSFILFIRGFVPFGTIPSYNIFSSTSIKRLTSFEPWIFTFLIMFYSMGQTVGMPLTLASFNNFKQSDQMYGMATTPGSTILISFINLGMLRAFENFLENIGINRKLAVRGGFNLAFLLYPDFINYSGSTQVWSGFWYFFLFVQEFNVVLTQFFATTTSVFDEFPKLRTRKILWIGILALFLVVVSVQAALRGMYPPVDRLLLYGLFVQVIITILELMAFTWGYPRNLRLAFDLKFTLGRSKKDIPNKIKTFGFSIPFILIIIFIWANIHGLRFLPAANGTWPSRIMIFFFTLMCLIFPGCVFYEILYKKRDQGTWKENIMESFKAKLWHPANKEDCESYEKTKRDGFSIADDMLKADTVQEDATELKILN